MLARCAARSTGSGGIRCARTRPCSGLLDRFRQRASGGDGTYLDRGDDETEVKARAGVDFDPGSGSAVMEGLLATSDHVGDVLRR